MDILENLYESQLPKITFFNRKISIDSDKTLIIGTRMSGKSSIIIDYLNNYKKREFLYIDLDDMRINKKSIKENLNSFLSSYKEIKLLVIENYSSDIELPNLKKIILTSIIDIDIKGFEKKYLYPLDFEEYLSWDKNISNIEHTFSTYSNTSTYPELSFSKIDNIKSYQDKIKAIFQDEIEIVILKELVKFQSEKISNFQIFNIIKANYKISKDRFYNFITKLEDEKFIFFLPKQNSPNSPKKIYFLDFNLKNKITFKKNFIKRFENILFLELIKRDKEIFYSDKIEFYLPKEQIAIIPIAFLPDEMVRKKIEKIINEAKKLNIKNIFAVTIGAKMEFDIDKIRCEVIPFWEFVFNLN